MASKDLKVNVIVNAKTKELDKMFKKLNNIQTQVNKQASAQNKVTMAVNKTNKAHKKSGVLIDQLTTKVHRLANAYLGVLGAKAALTASDTITSAENKLNHLNNGNTSATQNQLDKMYTSAQKVRMGYADMMNNVSKSMTLASGAFGDNIDNAIRFQEIMAEAYTLSGSSAAEMSSSMYQMIQGLGSGILQGDELRSVREGASLAYQAIEEFAQGIYGADKNLKDLAADGLITSDIVVKAILSNGKKMDESFANTSMTFAQAWTNIKNTALKAFEPVLQKMNDILNSDVGQAMINGIGTAIRVTAKAALWLFGIIEDGYNFIVDNWGAVKNVLIALSIILGSVLLVQVGQLISGCYKLISVAIASGTAWLASWWPLILIVGILILLIIQWANTTQTVCDFIYQVCLALVYGILACLTILLAAYLAGVTIVTGTINLTGLLIVGVLALLIAVFVKWTSQIVGLVYGLGSAIGAIFTNIKLAFQNILLAMQYLFWKWIDNIISDFKPLLEAINAVLAATGKKTIDVDFAANKAKALSEEIGFVSIGDAYREGYGKGAVVGQNIQDKINGFGEKIKSTLNGDGIEELLGLTPLPNENIAPDLGAIDNIDANTGKIADSMELTEEDLAYLKDVANMEWKKEFTTANITVDMTNNNTVSNGYDLNSLAIGLRNLVEEEMHVVANGVYA